MHAQNPKCMCPDRDPAGAGAGKLQLRTVCTCVTTCGGPWTGGGIHPPSAGGRKTHGRGRGGGEGGAIGCVSCGVGARGGSGEVVHRSSRSCQGAKEMSTESARSTASSSHARLGPFFAASFLPNCNEGAARLPGPDFWGSSQRLGGDEREPGSTLFFRKGGGRLGHWRAGQRGRCL